MGIIALNQQTKRFLMVFSQPFSRGRQGLAKVSVAFPVLVAGFYDRIEYQIKSSGVAVSGAVVAISNKCRRLISRAL